MGRRFAGSLLLGIGSWGAARALPPAEITVEEVVSARLPHPAELDAAERLTSAARRLAGASGLLLRGATLSAAAGPRRSDEAADSTDVALGVDLPLLFAGEEQRAAAAALEAAAPVLAQAGRASADLEVELAYLAAWRDAGELELRERELGLVDDWLALTRLRVESGAEPPFRVTVAVGERERVAAQRDQARVRALASRLALEALSPLPGEEVTWRGPVDNDAGAGGDPGPATPGDPRRFLLQRAVELGSELDLAMTALDSKADTARWALSSELAREGEEEVARLGLAYRIAPRRERRTVAAELLAAGEAIRRRGALEIAALASRVVAARRTIQASSPALDEAEVERALVALSALVAEGKARSTDVLAERRTLVDARIALLDRRHARAVARAELRVLTRRFEP